jgi:hypothetical protein
MPVPAVHKKKPNNPTGWDKAFACISEVNEGWVNNAPLPLLSMAPPTFRINGRPRATASK